MSGELSLFGDDLEPAAVPAGDPAEELAAPWQIKLLREMLDAQGLKTMAERQQAIEAAAGHPVESLKALTRREALFVAEHLGEVGGRTTKRSHWDDREDNTWIDNL
ncbi:hypothetical protein [Kineococcus sp. NUM-3379]